MTSNRAPLGVVSSAYSPVVSFPMTMAPALWLDASDASTISATAGAVTQWRDKSGNARHVAAGVSPVTGATTQNGLNVIDFTGDYLQASTAADWTFLHDGTTHLIGIVARVNSTSPDLGFLIGTGNTSGSQRGAWVWTDSRSSSGTLKHTAILPLAIDSTSSGGAFSLGTAHTLTVLGDADNATAADRSAMYVDGGAAIKNNAATAAVSALAPAQALAIGGAGNDSFGRLVGWIGEVIIVSGAEATGANRTALYDYLKAKWATP